MKKAGMFLTFILTLASLLLTSDGVFAATEGFYNLSTATASWDGTDGSRLKAPTPPDYDYTYGDEASLTYTLPWGFYFYDQSYNQINVDTNGNIWFGATGSAHSFTLGDTKISPTAPSRGPVIAAWNNDLSSYYYGGVFVQHKTNPERVVIEWQTETYSDEGYNLPNNIEVVLYQTGDIHIDYKTFSSSASKDFGSGISKGDGISYLSISSLYGNVPTLPNGNSFSFYRRLAINTTSLTWGTTGIAYNQTLAAIGGKPPYTWSIVSDSGSLPAGLNLNASTGAITGTPTTAGTSAFTIQAQDTSGSTASKSLAINIFSPLSVSTASLPSGIVNSTYSQTLAASGGKPPYTWSIVSGSGSLPAGLNLDASGVISGTPTIAVTSNFTVQVQDSNGSVAPKQLGIVISYPPAKIARATPVYFSTLQDAYEAAVYDEVIMVQAAFSGGLRTDRDIAVTITGGYNSDYSSNPDSTALSSITYSTSSNITFNKIFIKYN